MENIALKDFEKGTEPLNNSENTQQALDNKNLLQVNPVENTANVESEQHLETRIKWTNQYDFLFSSSGFIVNSFQIFRFPILCLSYGGLSFFIIYLIMLTFLAMPIFFLETCFGQYMKTGVISIWKICPLIKGVGYATILLNVYIILHYNITVAWLLHYFFASFSLPWDSCKNEWNSKDCVISSNNNSKMLDPNNNTIFMKSVSDYTRFNFANSSYLPRWEILVILPFVYVIIYLCVFKGIKVLGKIVWVTVIFPYVILVILFIRSVTLPGAGAGITSLILPDLMKLSQFSTWMIAALEIMLSIGIGNGVHISYSSYNDSKYSITKNCLITAAVNIFTSIFLGMMTFSFLGYLSTIINASPLLLTYESDSLVFTVLPLALARLPAAQFWCILFFIMNIYFCLNNSFGVTESLVTAILDEFEGYLSKFRYKREKITALLLFVLCILSFPNANDIGFLNLQSHGVISLSAGITIILFFEQIGFIWFYGIDNTCEIIKQMNGVNLPIGVRIVLKYLIPIVLFTLTIFLSIFLRTQYVIINHETIYPPFWKRELGVCIRFAPILLILIFGIVVFCRAEGKSWKEKLCLVISPNWQHEDIKSGQQSHRLQKKHWISI